MKLFPKSLLIISLYTLVKMQIISNAWYHVFLCSITFLLITIASIYIVFPFIYRYNHKIRRFFMFVHRVPYVTEDLDDPAQYGLMAAKNISLTIDGGGIRGWHIFPASSSHKYDNENDGMSFNRDERPIIIFFHGANTSRGFTPYVQMYQIFSETKIDSHVIAFNYRGFADSQFDSKQYQSSVPTLESVLGDMRNILAWTASKVRDSHRIIVWCHSLSNLLICQALFQTNIDPRLLFLQSAPNKMRDAFHEHPLPRLYQFLPRSIYRIITQDLHVNDDFDLADPSGFIGKIKCQMIFLHAEDDSMVPLRLGLKYYARALQENHPGKPTPRMVIFSRAEKIGHSSFYKFHQLPKLLHKWICEPQLIDSDPIFLPLNNACRIRYVTKVSLLEHESVESWTDDIP
ncbi:lysophosphatidylserine lipase ABHD12-like [Brevipalpus obovatus]|uniref:lysophosphatidylserine lipase ABHD12-like n=1 Tax=Brevipalpus obovatus TaxID=246614 RepID=UPI003D9E2D79